MTPTEKIAKAKELLWEATYEIRKTEEMKRKQDLCKCGHVRVNHAVTHSISFTDGFCKECDCEGFLFLRTQSSLRGE